MRPETTWIWGRRPVIEALRSGKVRRVLVARGIQDQAFLSELEQIVETSDARLETVDSSAIDQLARGETTQGVLAEVHAFSFSTIEQIIAGSINDDRASLMLILDQVQDPMNLGSLLRSAEVAGAHGAFITERRSAPITGTVSKASAGAIHHLAIAQSGNLTHLFTQLASSGIWTLGLNEDAPQTIYETDMTVPLAIVVGGEGSGMRRLTGDRVDMLASIPTLGHIESLNASVAGAIALFEAVRQRRAR